MTYLKQKFSFPSPEKVLCPDWLIMTEWFWRRGKNMSSKFEDWRRTNFALVPLSQIVCKSNTLPVHAVWRFLRKKPSRFHRLRTSSPRNPTLLAISLESAQGHQLLEGANRSNLSPEKQFPAINKLKQSYEYTNILVLENQIKESPFFLKKKVAWNFEVDVFKSSM